MQRINNNNALALGNNNNAQAPQIPIKISNETTLSFVPKAGKPKTELTLFTALNHWMPEGTQVAIGNNIYVLVAAFKNRVEDIPKKPEKLPLQKDLPLGIAIIMDNGIPVHLAGEIKVDLPPNCKIRLPANTKLQQVDVLVELTLNEEVDAILKT